MQWVSIMGGRNPELVYFRLTPTLALIELRI